MIEHSKIKEAEHFDYLVTNKGISWWGHQTEAGKQRLIRRANLIADYLGSGGQLKILEIGCGIGDLTKYLPPVLPSAQIAAIDISGESIRFAEKTLALPNVVFAVADVGGLPFLDQSFDAVVGNSILHHIDMEKTFREIRRVLKRGGKIFFSEPNMLNPEIFLERNIRFFGRWLLNSPEETAFLRWKLAKFLRRQDFSDVEVLPYDFLHPIVPQFLIKIVSGLGLALEKIPVLREASGSLIIRARY
ncbi:MAG: class I SAM-dependent methyltransferase [bacterium]